MTDGVRNPSRTGVMEPIRLICPECQYDLRSVEGAEASETIVCPECGASSSFENLVFRLKSEQESRSTLLWWLCAVSPVFTIAISVASGLLGFSGLVAVLPSFYIIQCLGLGFILSLFAIRDFDINTPLDVLKGVGMFLFYALVFTIAYSALAFCSVMVLLPWI